MEMKRKVSILGAGQWGTVLALLAHASAKQSRKSTQIYLFDRNAEKIRVMRKTLENKKNLKGISLPASLVFTSSLEEAVQSADLLVPVVPSVHFRDFVQTLRKIVTKDQIVVHGTKGLEQSTFQTMSEILLEELKTKLVGVVSGPNLALELAAGSPAGSTIASPSTKVVKTFADFFGSNQFRVYGNKDLKGVEWIGALKNILALAAGIISESNLGQNTMATLLTRGVRELEQLLEELDCSPRTLLGLAGLGDILATCSSPLSRNFQAGVKIARKISVASIEESTTTDGLATLKAAYSFSKKSKLEMPIIQALYGVIYKDVPLQVVLNELMQRPFKYE